MFRRAFAAILVGGFLGTAARAETPPSPDDVSQINGQIVPVGDHARYLYTFKRWNVSANPVGWIAGFYGVSGSYGFHSNFALRVDVNYYAPQGRDDDGFELGVGLPIYFRKTYQGPFLEPGFVGRRLGDGPSALTEIGPQVLVGWQWMWDSGLNIAVAAGVGRNLASGAPDEDEDDSEVFANGYLRFGYAF